MKLTISLVVALQVGVFAASAKKVYQSIPLVAARADYIVVGEIVGVEPAAYQFKVTEYLKGRGQSIVAVQPFKEWACDVRYARVAKGQRLVLFLQRHGAALDLIDGSTGEIPIVNNRITLEHESYDYRGTAAPYSLDLEEFKTGIKEFVGCFRFQAIPDVPHSGKLVPTCGPRKLSTFGSGSSFTQWLYRRSESAFVAAVR